MKTRLIPYNAAPEVMQALVAVDKAVRKSGLETSLLNLIRTRASQINGCAFCIQTHTREARARGESEDRLYLLDIWREVPLYSERERAALAWTEAVTLVAQGRVPETVYETARRHFSEAELTKLTVAIATINAWNRIAISFRSSPSEAQSDAA